MKRRNNSILIMIAVLLIILYYIVTRCSLWRTTKEGIQNYTDKSSTFCKTNKHNARQRHSSCGSLTQKNCKNVGCCVWTSEQKCVAGDESGPLYNSTKGKTQHLDYYFFNNKCYGDKCSC